MSEAMSKREIEDVLSSIRRLVSQGGGDRVANVPRLDITSGPGGNGGQGKDDCSGKLVLTAALRVAPVPDAIPVTQHLPAADLAEASSPAPGETATSGFRLPQAMLHQADDQGMNNDIVASNTGSRMVGVTYFGPAPGEGARTGPAMNQSQTDSSMGKPLRLDAVEGAQDIGLEVTADSNDARASAQTMRQTALEDPVASAPVKDEDGASDGDAAMPVPCATTTPGEDDAPPEQSRPLGFMAQAPEATDDANMDDESVDMVLSRLEAALADTGQATAARRRASNVDMAASAAPRPLVVADKTDPASATGTGTALVDPRPESLADMTMIDEATLNALVANIVRQELQGELGERITRNIRKLVRAEVAREMQLRKH